MTQLSFNQRGGVTRRHFLRAGVLAAAAVAASPRTAYAQGASESTEDPDRLGRFRLGRVIYENPLRSPADVRDFRLEGQAIIGFPEGRLRMENELDPELGQEANYVYWFDVRSPESFAASWDFHPLREPGLCIVFFGARGRNGEDIFDPSLAPRAGTYRQYNRGDIDTLHLAYFRRRWPSERAFHLCNLRKSHGHNLVASAADPLPPVADAQPPYRIELIKLGAEVAFFINRLPVLSWMDDGQTYGPVIGGGAFGFRQMAPLRAEYENFVMREVSMG